MHEIRIPRLGWSMEEGTFVRWLRNQGESVARGDALFELEGDEIRRSKLSKPVRCVLARMHRRQAPRVEVGTLLGYLLAAGERPPAGSPAVRSDAAEESPYIAAGPRPGEWRPSWVSNWARSQARADRA